MASGKRLVKFGLGGVVGAAIGTVVASFLAPQRGEDLQKGVQDRLTEAKEAGEQAKTTTENELMQRFRDRVKDQEAFTASTSQGQP